MLRVARCAQQKAFDRAPLTRQTNRAYRSTSDPQRAQCGARQFHIIFGHDDVSGRRFDVALILISSAGILVALLDSVESMHAQKTKLHRAAYRQQHRRALLRGMWQVQGSLR